MTILTRADLAHAKCEDQNCTKSHKEPLFFSPRCHPASATLAEYSPPSGVLKLSCFECGREVVRLQIGESK